MSRGFRRLLNARLTPWHASLCAIACGAASALAGEGLSPALEKALRSRERIATAQFDYVERFITGDHPINRFVTWRCAGPDYIQVDHGDERGTVARVRDRPDEAVRQPDLALVVDGQSWRRNEADGDVRVVPWEQWSLPDFRTVGIDPTGSKDLQFAKRIAMKGGAITYREEREGGLVLVTAETSLDSQFRWWIDPERDWNIVRTQTLVDGELWYEQRITLEKMEGIWFPQRIQCFSGQAEDGALTYDLQIFRVEINRPEHPRRFGPNDIGVEPGMLIADGRRGLAEIWDGQKPVSQVEFFNRVSAGEVQLGPTVLRLGKRAEIAAEMAERRNPAEHARATTWPAFDPTPTTLPATQASAAIDLADWEKYTLDFIRKHELDAGQAERALAILRDCQDAARALVLRRAALAAPRSVPGPQGGRDGPRAEEQRAVIDRRIDRIFRDELAPRLDSLLTSRQREKSPTP